MRLNVCAGRHILDGWVNIDVVASDHPKAKGRKPEILADARSIPLDDGVADEILCVHGWEHFYLWECEDLIAEWKRLLKPGGRLVLEMPDILKCCENILSGYTVPNKHPDQYGYWGAFGDPTTRNPYMMHKWGWHPKSLRDFLELHGMVDVRDEVPEWHAAGKSRRDMRITARKPA